MSEAKIKCKRCDDDATRYVQYDFKYAVTTEPSGNIGVKKGDVHKESYCCNKHWQELKLKYSDLRDYPLPR